MLINNLYNITFCLLGKPFLLLGLMQVIIGLKAEIIYRKLELEDHKRGFIELLGQLTEAPALTNEKFKKIFDTRSTMNTYTLVAVDQEKNLVIGTGSVVFEAKFIRCGIMKGYIEEMVISKEYRGMGLGINIINKLIDYSVNEFNVYKLVLSADMKNKEFYEKCGFIQKEIAFELRPNDLQANKIKSKILLEQTSIVNEHQK